MTKPALIIRYIQTRFQGQVYYGFIDVPHTSNRPNIIDPRDVIMRQAATAQPRKTDAMRIDVHRGPSRMHPVPPAPVWESVTLTWRYP